MNLQPLIDNLPMILVGISLVLAALAYLFSVKAKANPEIDFWDKWLPTINSLNQLYSKGIDMLCDSKHLNFKGKDKLVELNRLMKEAKVLIEQGKYLEAISAAWGYYTDAEGKLNKVSANPSIGPDDQAWDTQAK